jgi:hypothetical protein
MTPDQLTELKTNEVLRGVAHTRRDHPLNQIWDAFESARTK